jgi:hypothetical protein
MAEKREGAPPVRLSVKVEFFDEEEPITAWVELHPGGGWRIMDEEGQTWAGQGPQIRRVAGAPPPVGLDEMWLLATADEEILPAHVARLGIDLSLNELARCGEVDCFVLGGREGQIQLWVDKERFEVRRYRNPQGLFLHFDGYQKVGGTLRLPTRIRVVGEFGPVSQVGILETEPSPGLRGDPELRPPGQGKSPARRH